MNRIKTRKNEVKLLRPSNLNVNDLNIALTGKAGTSRIQQRTLYLYCYLIKSGFNTENPNGFGREWTPIHSDLFRSIFGDGYGEVTNLLIATGHLERYVKVDEDTGEIAKIMGQPGEYGYYVPPVMSVDGKTTIFPGTPKQYRIPAILIGEEKNYCIFTQKAGKAEQNMLSAINDRITALNEANRLFIREQMRTVVLVDSPECREVLNHLRAEKSIRLTAGDFLAVFNNNPFIEAPIDNFGWRVHSQVVTVPRTLRPFLRFQDHPDSHLVEIDIVNSQPAILASLNSRIIKRFAPECAEAIPFFRAAESEPNYKEFQQHCFGKTIYEELCDCFNRTYSQHLVKPIERNDAKKIFFVASFGNYEFYETQDMWVLQQAVNDAIQYDLSEKELDDALNALLSFRSYQVFKTRFPAVWQLFYAIKKLEWNFSPSFNKDGSPKRYANNCLLAQRVESGLIFTVLIEALRRAGIERMVTIHDAILVRAQDEKKARKIIQNEFERLKLKLRLKTK